MDTTKLRKMIDELPFDPLIVALRSLSEALEREAAAMREQCILTVTMYRAACEDDPGLEHAWQSVRFADHDIGWLDVALARSEWRRA